MTDFAARLRRLGELRDRLDPELDDRDLERLVRASGERRQRARTQRLLGFGVALGALGTVLLVLLLRLPATESATPAAASGSAAPAASWAFSDQSRATAIDPSTLLAVEDDAPERVRLRLERGSARFEVTRRPGRSFSVQAGGVSVNVVGTVFAVEVVADRVGVSVEHGAVEVDWGLGRRMVAAGEKGWFPPLALDERSGARELVPHDEPAAAPAASVAAAPSPSPAARPSAEPSTPSVAELLAEVDRARAEGQPARAAEILRTIVRERAGDPRVPLAAFTLGRVLLNELGRPREAAAAFQEVRSRAPGSSFAEDALAREVEAWTRASEPARARGLAKAYLERFPSGRHVRKVKALTGLE